MSKQNDFNLIWIDLEMTGLNPEQHTIVEIATVVTDSELNVIGEGPVTAIHHPPNALENMDDFEAYEKAVDEHYKVYAKVFNFVRAKIKKDFNFFKSLPDFMSIFRYMKKNEDRFGMDIKIGDLMKVAKA